MKLPSFAEKIVVKAVLSRSGPLIQKAVTAGVAFAVGYLSSKLPGSEQFLTPEVLGGVVWLVLDLVVSKLAAGPLKEYGKELQALLNRKGASLNEDSFVGPVTVQAAKQLLNDK